MKYLPYILLGVVIIIFISLVAKKDNDSLTKINFHPNRVKIY